MAALTPAPSSCTFSSSISMRAASAQYPIDTMGPVRVTLHSPSSYCYLKSIDVPGLKDILAKVGAELESRYSGFMNVHHTFTLTEATETKSDSRAEAVVEDHYSQFQCILAMAKTGIAKQVSLGFALTVSDITKLVVNKVLHNHARAYTLDITLSENGMKLADKAGLVFQDYITSIPKGTIATHVGVAQFSFI